MAYHPIVHVDFEAENPKELAAFYAALFGWQIQTDAQTDYTMFEAGSGPVGGFVPLSPGNHVIPYIQTDDIEATLTQAVALGGKVIITKQESAEGFWAVFTDPTGNKVGLLSKTMPS